MLGSCDMRRSGERGELVGPLLTHWLRVAPISEVTSDSTVKMMALLFTQDFVRLGQTNRNVDIV